MDCHKKSEIKNQKLNAMRFRTPFSLFLLFSLSLIGCKKWDDHIAVNDADLTKTLWDVISADATLSTFAKYMQQTGADSIAKSSKTFTVWAPTNDALKTLDTSVTNNAVNLKRFVFNHLAYQSYTTRDVATPVLIQTLSGKWYSASATRFNDATLVSKDKYVANGVLHAIDKAILVLPSLWEFVNSTTAQYAQNAFISSLNFNDFDPSLATVDSISATTGDPIYRPGTGIVVRNRFNSRVADLRAEERQYTYFVLADAAFALEADSLKKYYAVGGTAFTDSLAKWNTVKDLIVEGLYTPAQLTGLVSRFGVALPVNPADIVATRQVSNGIVYVLSKLDIPTANKFPTLVVQGENPAGLSISRTVNFPSRTNPVTGVPYNEVLITGHATTGFYAFYRLSEVPVMKYKVYALGTNDFQTGTFTQNIVVKGGVGSTATTLGTLAHAVPAAYVNQTLVPAAYNELYLGEVTFTGYGTIEIQLTASSSANPLVLDYLRLVPQP